MAVLGACEFIFILGINKEYHEFRDEYKRRLDGTSRP